MKLVLTLRAEADIDSIAAYIWTRNPLGALRVEAAIQSAFRLVEAYPLVGHETRPGIRRFGMYVSCKHARARVRHARQR